MKQIMIILMTACLVVSMTACGAGNNGETTLPAEIETLAEGFAFPYNGTVIRLHAPAAPIIEALGEPKSYTEQTSCAFEGLDKTYYFGSFYLETYPKGDEDYIYGWWFADDSVATEEGIRIGATQAEVEEAYGADSFNGSSAYTVTEGEGTLIIILEDGIVSSIQYAIDLSE